MNFNSQYNVPAPRYTSYPTVPCWTGAPGQATWKAEVKERFLASNRQTGISLYIHLPFCESLCTYCACNTRITVNHAVEKPYIEALLNEWRLYLDLFGQRPVIRELHLGGGTPTFFSAQHLEQLLTGILDTACLHPEADLSFEGHPANTSAAHLQSLRAFGFRRVSFGIQDFDPRVQEAINRHQPAEQVRLVVDQARQAGYTSVNFDLVYGLPFQSIGSMHNTLQQVLLLRPDRIAFYSYAHVPWLKPGQRKFTENDLPLDADKRALYNLGQAAFLSAGYQAIGMDHFALPGDTLCKASAGHTLHRNFMGYTSSHTQLLIGLGASAISDCLTAFAQNDKKVESYCSRVNSGAFAFCNGHQLTEEDQFIGRQIENLMCRFETSWTQVEECCHRKLLALIKAELPLGEGFVKLCPNGVVVTDKGKPYVRNICMAFDQRLRQRQLSGPTFSSVA